MNKQNNGGRLVDIKVVEEGGELGLSLRYTHIRVYDKLYDLYIPFLKLGFDRDTVPDITEGVEPSAVGIVGTTYVTVHFDNQKYYLKPSDVDVLGKDYCTRHVQNAYYTVVDRTKEEPPKYTIDEIFEVLNAQSDCLEFTEDFIENAKTLLSKKFGMHTCENCRYQRNIYAGDIYFKKCAKCGKEKKNWERRY